jgi:hypothetical protein
MTDAVPMTSPPNRVGPLGYVLAGVLVVAAIGWAGWSAWEGFANFDDGLQQIAFRGTESEADFTLRSTGSKKIFHEFHSRIGDESVSNPQSIDGLRVELTNPHGDHVDVDSSIASEQYSFSGHEGVAVARFQADSTGTWHIKAQQDNSNRYVLAIGGSPIANVFKLLGKIVIPAVVLGLLGLIVFIVTVVRRSQATKRQRQYAAQVGS